MEQPGKIRKKRGSKPAAAATGKKICSISFPLLPVNGPRLLPKPASNNLVLANSSPASTVDSSVRVENSTASAPHPFLVTGPCNDVHTARTSIPSQSFPSFFAMPDSGPAPRVFSGVPSGARFILQPSTQPIAGPQTTVLLGPSGLHGELPPPSAPSRLFPDMGPVIPSACRTSPLFSVVPVNQMLRNQTPVPPVNRGNPVLPPSAPGILFLQTPGSSLLSNLDGLYSSNAPLGSLRPLRTARSLDAVGNTGETALYSPSPVHLFPAVPRMPSSMTRDFIGGRVAFHAPDGFSDEDLAYAREFYSKSTVHKDLFEASHSRSIDANKELPSRDPGRQGVSVHRAQDRKCETCDSKLPARYFAGKLSCTYECCTANIGANRLASDGTTRAGEIYKPLASGLAGERPSTKSARTPGTVSAKRPRAGGPKASLRQRSARSSLAASVVTAISKQPSSREKATDTAKASTVAQLESDPTTVSVVNPCVQNPRAPPEVMAAARLILLVRRNSNWEEWTPEDVFVLFSALRGFEIHVPKLRSQELDGSTLKYLLDSNTLEATLKMSKSAVMKLSTILSLSKAKSQSLENLYSVL